MKRLNLNLNVDFHREFALATRQAITLVTSVRSIMLGILWLTAAVALIFLAYTPAAIYFQDDNETWWVVTVSLGLATWVAYWAGFVLRRDNRVNYDLGNNDIVQTNRGFLAIATGLFGLFFAAVYEAPLPALILAAVVQVGAYAASYAKEDYSDMVKNLFFHACNIALIVIGVWMILTG